MTESAQDNAGDDLATLQSRPQAVASWRTAQQHLIQGRPAAALNGYRNLVKQFPGVAALWMELGLAATAELDFALARQASRRAAELAGADSTLLVSIGQQYHRLRRLQEASACFVQAVAADPSSVHARLSLAAWLERNRQLDQARECVEDCLKEHPREARALYFRAFLRHRQGRNGEAETALRDLLKSNPPDPNVKISASHLLGVVLDATGQYAEAMRFLRDSKTLARQLTDTAALEKTYDKMSAARRELLAALTAETIRRWREEADAAPCPHPPAFLGGPPRSGTTLIEQVLGAHPQILVFDEPEAFAQEVLNTLAPMPPAKALTLKSLHGLTAPVRANLIRRYGKSLLRQTEETPGGMLLLDKNPSLTTSLHVWLRLFPASKIIITLRDPRDLVISCYFQSLTLTPVNANFLSLVRTAKFYSDCMDAWLRLRDLGGFEWMETRYEDIVNNLEAGGRRLTEFLGLPWHESQAKYYEAARQKFVFAPTYHDVTQPVYRRAVRRWEHYAEALAPLQAALAPYCRAFGYAD
ncbi:MAG TPA: sulfotransferase [Candidatus Acidoferrum sp.]|nr:sulfotransferase [Candidatus Acidoferrum sp.]